MDRVTVVICCFNYGRYLEKAINSAINQTVKPKQIVIVDDNSDDNTWSVISSFCRKNQLEDSTRQTPNGDVLLKVGLINEILISGIKLPRTSGPSIARNSAIDFTIQNTDFFMMLDADDEALPNKIEELLKPFKNPTVGLTYADYYNINEENGVSLLECKPAYDIFELNKSCIVHSGFMVRANLLNQVKDSFGYYDAEMRVCEDWELEIRLSKVCLFYHIAIPLTKVLVHNNNSTNSVNRQIWEQNWNRIQQKHFIR